MAIAGFVSFPIGFVMGGVIGGLVGAPIGALMISLTVVLLVKGMFRRVVARPEGLEVDGELIAWVKTSEPELSGRHAQIRLTTRNGPEDVALFYGQFEEIAAVKELRARALFVPPHVGPYRS
jgi:hypothetical protein